MRTKQGKRARPWARGGGAVGLALMAGLALAPTASAQTGTVSGNKTVADTDIQCNGSTTVTLTLNGQTGIAGEPADIVLVLDRSGSMQGAPLAALTSGANQFVDIIDEGTDGELDGVIANVSRVGVVSFADSASENQPLTGSA